MFLTRQLPIVIFTILLTLALVNGYANTAQLKKTQLTIEKLYRNLTTASKLTMAERLEIVSGHFLGKPYRLGALGEGKNARYDQSPLYRTDSFDCETFVDTVLAIALSNNMTEFKQTLRKIRYQQGQIQFIKRNHFTDLDWNRNNQHQGYLKDITPRFKDSHHQKITLLATATINKPSWYHHLTTANIKLRHPNATQQEIRLLELQKQGSQLPVAESTIPYIPLTRLFLPNGHPNKSLFAQIPNAAIIEIIRPNWDLRDQIGTCLNVSHLGFVFWKNKQLIFRQASTIYQRIVDVPLIDYLKQAQSSPTIKGINIQIVAVDKPIH